MHITVEDQYTADAAALQQRKGDNGQVVEYAEPRGMVVMGMVGAGGIGFELMGSLRIMQYQEVSAILIVILLMVTVVDSLSGRLRKKFK